MSTATNNEPVIPEAEKGLEGDVEKGDIAIAHEGEVAKGYKLGPFTLPAYRSPLTQTILIGIVCFLVVGMCVFCSRAWVVLTFIL